MSQDISLVFSSAQNVFGNGTTVVSDQWIDLKKAMDLAGGLAPELEVIVTTTFAGGTGVRFQLTAVDSAGANPVVLDTTDVIPVASLVAPTTAGGTSMGGSRFLLKMSPKLSLPGSTLTHLRMQVVNVGNNAAGAVSAQLMPKAATGSPNKAYAAGW